MKVEYQNENPVFVVGLLRSGTTLMSSMLSAHPAIAISPDTHYIQGWVRQHRNLQLSRPADFERFWYAFSNSERFSYLGIDAAAVRQRIEANQRYSFRGVYLSTLEAYAASMQKRRWGEKTPPLSADYLETLFNWFPDARVVYMLRDPRAVVASLRNTPWGAKLGVDVHALSWADGVRRAGAYEADRRMWWVHYEDLVQRPTNELNQVCRFLGEVFSPEMVKGRYTLLSSTLRNRKGWVKEHLTAALRPVHKNSIRKWENELTPLEIDVIEHCCGRVMKRAGYSPVGTPLPARRRACMFIESHAARIWRRIGGRQLRSASEHFHAAMEHFRILRRRQSWR